MIKVQLLIPTLDRSGAEKQFALLAGNLPRDEFDVQAAALTRGGPYESELQQAGIPLTVLHKRWKFDPAALIRLKRLIARFQPDVVHSWLFAANAYGRLAVSAGSRPMMLVSERCVDTWKSGWQLWLDRRLISKTDRLIGNSQSVGDFYRQQGFPAKRIAVIPNGIDCGEPAAFNREEALAEFDIPANARVVGYVGRLARQKRVEDLIWGIELLRHVVDPVYLLVVGDGPDRSRIVERARKLDCEKLIRFAGHRDDARKLIRLMDVFWLASDFEGMSNSVMEAMAAGVPVVASDIPPNRELVIDGETGFLVNVGDQVGFAQFTERILADDDLASRLGNRGRERMQEEFSVQKMVAAHAELYRQVVLE